MAILYKFKVTDPTGAGPVPPSVSESAWFAGLLEYWTANAVGGISNNMLLIFNDETELNNYINTYKLTDASLQADLDAWKTAHNITYTSSYYTLTDAGISPTPTPVIS